MGLDLDLAGRTSRCRLQLALDRIALGIKKGDNATLKKLTHLGEKVKDLFSGRKNGSRYAEMALNRSRLARRLFELKFSPSTRGSAEAIDRAIVLLLKDGDGRFKKEKKKKKKNITDARWGAFTAASKAILMVEDAKKCRVPKANRNNDTLLCEIPDRSFFLEKCQAAVMCLSEAVHRNMSVVLPFWTGPFVSAAPANCSNRTWIGKARKMRTNGTKVQVHWPSSVSGVSLSGVLEHPAAWYLGTLLGRLMRPSPAMEKNVTKFLSSFGLPHNGSSSSSSSFTVGIHVYRPGVEESENEVPLSEYVAVAEAVFQTREALDGGKLKRRRIYMATEDIDVLEDAQVQNTQDNQIKTSSGNSNNSNIKPDETAKKKSDNKSSSSNSNSRGGKEALEKKATTTAPTST